MKILPVEKIREADQFTILHEPVASIDLMERAAQKCNKWLKKRVSPDRPVKIFCGPGNNGGDGLALARLMSEYHQDIRVYTLGNSGNFSEDYSINTERLQNIENIRIHELRQGEALPKISREEVVIDAIFGSGLNKPVQGWAAAVIRHLNESAALIVAIDIPSGLFSDQHTDLKSGAVVRADYTLSFQLPKLAFLFPENDSLTGEWVLLDIGLSPEYLDRADTMNHLLTPDLVASLLKPRTKFAHKGHFGHALLMAGGYGRMGAAVLAAKGCLRSGVGLLHVHAPSRAVNVMQCAVPEAMLTIDRDAENITGLPDLKPFNAIGMGPAIGMEAGTATTLKLLLQEISVPLVLDADALTILGENKTWIPFIPKNAILTPHPKEFERLAGKAKDDFDRHRLHREFCVRHGVYLILKGAHTAICGPDGVCYFNTTGNPGMATGGSGDVLTGLILGLLAQNYSPRAAALLGVYLHGLAGDFAADKLGLEAMVAGDIIAYTGKAFRKLYDLKEKDF